MKRLAQFLRSVIPVDPWQLVFLVGIIFISISPRLPLWPSKLIDSSYPASRLLQSETGRLELRQFIVASLYPIMFAGIAGYFLCFWPGKRPVRRILWAVCLPTAISLAAVLWKFFQITQPATSIFEPHGRVLFGVKPFQLDALKLTTEFYFAACGLLLVLVYTIRLALGLASVQFSLSDDRPLNEVDGESWARVRRLVFVLVGPYFLLAGLAWGLFLGIPYVASSSLSPRFWTVTSNIAVVLDGVFLVGISLLVLGKQGSTAAKVSLHLPEPRFALVALAIPIVISGLVPGAQYLFDRVHWAAYDFGRFEPPQLSSYFGFANSWQPWLLLMVSVCLGEEIVFRGLLLPRFIARLGLQRGIFLTGIVWGAVHFRADSYTGLTVGGVLLHLANRVLLCLAMNYVFAWMTLRWKSIIPSAIAHTAWNILTAMQLGSRNLWNWEFSVAVWALLAYVLFRVWPIVVEEMKPVEQSDAGPEPAF